MLAISAILQWRAFPNLCAISSLTLYENDKLFPPKTFIKTFYVEHLFLYHYVLTIYYDFFHTTFYTKHLQV